MKIKSHLIFYRKVENDIVEIVRILHQRMDIKKRKPNIGSYEKQSS